MIHNSNLRTSEEGMVLVFVTIVLALAALVIPPLLGFIGGAGRSAQIREDRMLQVYAADMGVEDAYFRIASADAELPQEPGDDPMVFAIEDVNGSDVAIEIYKEPEHPLYGNVLYRVISTATNYNGVGATIESYVAAWDYHSLLEYGLASPGNIEISSNAEITGNLALNGELDNKGTINGEVTYGVPGWPDVDMLSERYSGQVSGSCGSSPLLVSGNETLEIGPCKTNGDLVIKGDGDVKLGGTFYVAGDLDFDPTPNMRVILNGETIYVEGSINIGPGCKLSGPGAIIAAGDIYFSPNMIGNGFIFVMSVEGTLTAQPHGHFYGSLAGGSSIDLQPGTDVEWKEPPAGLNFPGGDDILPKVARYSIK
jgi:formylmethanofuran dehydrogenase subunit C